MNATQKATRAALREITITVLGLFAPPPKRDRKGR